MNANQSSSINLQRRIRVLGVCFALTGLFTLVISAVRGRDSQGASQIKLSVEDPRPVAEAILKLEAKHGWIITYEDPRYVHESEIADVTLKVRRDLDKYKPGEAPRVFVPRGGVLEFTYDVVPNTNLPTDPARVVQKLLDAQAARGNGGRFRLETVGQIMHVIPTMIKNREGALVPQESVLDTIISLPAEDRTVYRKMESICAAIHRATGIPVVLGTIPDNWFSRERDQQGAKNQKARDVLVSTFESMDSGTNLSWQLFYGPGTKRYSLNIHYAQKQSG
jgi:hypothetical protein